MWKFFFFRSSLKARRSITPDIVFICIVLLVGNNMKYFGVESYFGGPFVTGVVVITKNLIDIF